MRKTAIVTGGSRGIGRACVEKLCRNGWSVAFLYRNSRAQADQLVDALREEGHDVYAWQCDVADSVQLKAVLEEIIRAFRHIDLLVSNAGVAWTGLLTDMTDDEWDHLFDVNVKAAFCCIRAVAPGMTERRQGSIICISSMWGQVGASCEAAYSATKAALIGLTRAMAQELGLSGVRVNCIAPGVIATEMNDHLSEDDLTALADETPLGRIGTPDDVADTVLFLAGESSSFITGQVIGVNGGFVTA